MSLVGAWVIDKTDARALAEFGDVRMEFGAGDDLTYTILEQGRRQIMLLRYKVEGSVLITEQPSHPRVERTEFSFVENKLILEFGGVPYRFVRAA